MRPVNRISPGDSLERAASEMRRNGTNLIPIVENDILVGIVTDSSLAVAMAEGAPVTDAAETAMVRAETIAPYATGAEALRCLAEGDGRPLVVIDDLGRPMGVLSAADLYATRRGPAVRPPSVGGMATPFGVYLTTGSVRGGASPYAIVGTGAILGALLVGSEFLVLPLATYMEKHGVRANIVDFVQGALTIAVFLLGMRLIPLSGTHAAEHQVVHAIERNEELIPEVVRRMPRVHPRCGTNLAAGAAIFNGIFWSPWPKDGELRFLLAAIATFLFWRPVGSFLQQYVTTRRPSDRQLAGGIRAGEELLDRYSRSGNSVPSIPRRLWNSGLFHVMAGSTLFMVAAELIGKLFHQELGLW
jgi:CBS domain-containing protein